MAKTELTIMSFVSFIQAVEGGAANLFSPSRRRVVTRDSRLRANERVLVPVPCKMMAKILKRWLLRIISHCAVDPVAAAVAFTCAGEIDWIVPDFLRRVLYTLQTRRLF